MRTSEASPRWSADGNAVNPAPRAMTRTSVTALGGPDPYVRHRCDCGYWHPVATMVNDHKATCPAWAALNPTTEAG